MRIFFLISLPTFLFCLLPAQELSIIERGNLIFGEQIFPGVDETVAYTDAEAASFEIEGDSGAEVRVTFQLPFDLNLDSNTLSVTYGSISAGYHIQELGQSTATAFDPKEGVTTSLGADGKLFIWLGGTIHPSHTQQKGTYIGDIILEAEYTSN